MMMYRIVAVVTMCAAMTVTSYTIQEEGDACFDMASSMPGLQTLPGKHFIWMNAHCCVWTS